MHAAVGAPQSFAERHPDRLREALTERAAGDLEAGRPLERALLDPRAVHSIRAQLVELVQAELVRCGEDGDRTVSGREHEMVVPRAELVEVEDGHQIREREALSGVALAAAAAHLDHGAPDPVRAPGQRHVAVRCHRAALAIPAASSPSSPRM